jgi:hypothetical protein
VAVGSLVAAVQPVESVGPVAEADGLAVAAVQPAVAVGPVASAAVVQLVAEPDGLAVAVQLAAVVQPVVVGLVAEPDGQVAAVQLVHRVAVAVEWAKVVGPRRSWLMSTPPGLAVQVGWECMADGREVEGFLLVAAVWWLSRVRL